MSSQGFFDEMEQFLQKMERSTLRYNQFLDQLQSLWQEGSKLGLFRDLEEIFKAGSLPPADGKLATQGFAVPGVSPQVDVRDQGDRIKVTVTAPELLKADYRWSCKADDHILHLRGRRLEEQSVQNDGGGFFDRRMGQQWIRSIRLPVPVEPKPLAVSSKDGALSLVFLKSRKAGGDDGWFELKPK